MHGRDFIQMIRVDVTDQKRSDKELKASFERLRQSLESTISALASALELRDPYTAGHQQRVTDLACAIAEEMGLGEEQIAGIRMAGRIHDIGKINIPAEILNKPGPLNEIEYSLFKNHPQVGHDVLENVEFPWPVAQIVFQHHERMDGSGYPQGLSGEEIILEARILAVADIVEAIASHRPYRPARGIGDALEEILHNKGILYDSAVVDACLRVFYERGFQFEQSIKVTPLRKIH
jgi:putative nucleotidyltransferase with HDIG domain